MVSVCEMKSVDSLSNFKPKVIDDMTLEVSTNKDYTFHDLLNALAKQGFYIKDFRPKGQRLEKLFLELLKQ